MTPEHIDLHVPICGDLVPLGTLQPGRSFTAYEDAVVGETQLVRVHQRRDDGCPRCECGRPIIPGDIYLRVWGTETGTGYWHATCWATAGLLFPGGCAADRLREAEADGEITWDDRARAWRDTR